MKTIGSFEFPTAREEMCCWQPYTIHTALARRVLVVAHTRYEGAWCAYVDAVPGENHKNEQAVVLESGDKLSERIARMLFPIFHDVPYAD